MLSQFYHKFIFKVFVFSLSILGCSSMIMWGPFPEIEFNVLYFIRAIFCRRSVLFSYVFICMPPPSYLVQVRVSGVSYLVVTCLGKGVTVICISVELSTLRALGDFTLKNSARLAKVGWCLSLNI